MNVFARSLLVIVVLLLAGIVYGAFDGGPRKASMSDCPAPMEFKADEIIIGFDEVKIKREHSGGSGYELSIISNGSVTFQRAKDNLIKPTEQLLPEKNAEIVQAINEAAFFSIPTDKYQIEACEHSAIVSISVTAEGKSHRVSRLCCKPPRQLIGLENSIHRIANTGQLTKESANPY